jgi:preprotein translocase subunit Sec63
LNPNRLKEKLTPAAKALGIVQAFQVPLSITTVFWAFDPKADAQEIKKAFRRKAGQVHPDACANPKGSNRQFVELNDAYRTLRDPVLRHHYDTIRQHLLHWRERPTWSLPPDRRPTLFLWYFYGLIFIFVLFFIFLNKIVF